MKKEHIIIIILVLLFIGFGYYTFDMKTSDTPKAVIQKNTPQNTPVGSSAEPPIENGPPLLDKEQNPIRPEDFQVLSEIWTKDVQFVSTKKAQELGYKREIKYEKINNFSYMTEELTEPNGALINKYSIPIDVDRAISNIDIEIERLQINKQKLEAIR